MNALQLTKAEKKLARQIIEKGLMQEYATGIEKQSKIIEQWKNNQFDNKDAYLKLYKSLTNYDKHIARRYDRMSGSKYLYIIAELLADKIINLQDINNLTKTTKDKLLLLSGISK